MSSTSQDPPFGVNRKPSPPVWGTAKSMGAVTFHVDVAVTDAIGVTVGLNGLPVSAATSRVAFGSPVLTAAKRSGACRFTRQVTRLEADEPFGSNRACLSDPIVRPNGSPPDTTLEPPSSSQLAAPC